MSIYWDKNTDSRVKRPDLKRIKILLAIFAGGMLYYIELQTLGVAVPCAFRMITGLKCPGCGITAGIVAALEGNLQRAVIYNLGLAVSLPILLPYLIICLYKWLYGKSLNNRWMQWISAAFAAYFLLWGIVRNCLHM